MYFRIYEEYERLKAQGVINLNQYKERGERHGDGTIAQIMSDYIDNKILHDQIGIYKFIVAEDWETIIYSCYLCGVMWKSLPRDSFNSPDFSDGIKYSIDAKAAFVDDDPAILMDFNWLCKKWFGNPERKTHVPLINLKKSTDVDMAPVLYPFIYKSQMHGHKIYKLKFFK